MRQTVVFDVQSRYELEGDRLEAADAVGAAAGMLASAFSPIAAQRVAGRVMEAASAWTGLDEEDVETAELALAVLAVAADEIARMRLALVQELVLPEFLASAERRGRDVTPPPGETDG